MNSLFQPHFDLSTSNSHLRPLSIKTYCVSCNKNLGIINRPCVSLLTCGWQKFSRTPPWCTCDVWCTAQPLQLPRVANEHRFLAIWHPSLSEFASLKITNFHQLDLYLTPRLWRSRKIFDKRKLEFPGYHAPLNVRWSLEQNTSLYCKDGRTISKPTAALHLTSLCYIDTDWLIELRFYIPLHTKIGHFRDVPQANLLAWYGKTKPNTTKAPIQ